MILIISLAVCRGTHVTVLVAAEYLKIWVVKDSHLSQVRQGAIDELIGQGAGLLGTGEGLPPPPPKGSLHEDWPEPSPRNATGLERYCQAFLMENQLWLQLAFAELRDKQLMTQHRESLLQSLATLLEEMRPEQYTPPVGQVGESLRFGADAPHQLSIAAGELRQEGYKGSIAHALVRCWRQRAQFMLHLTRITAMVKMDSYERRGICELCARTQGLVVTPIYTLTHLASSYRQQRDMSPLWNTALWRHFYQTFTPTCTLCEACQQYYYRRNQNVPVDEQRFQRLQEKSKTAYECVEESRFPTVPMDPDAKKVLLLWLTFTRHIGRGENPKDFLPTHGFEGRTSAEIRQERLDKEAALEAARQAEEEMGLLAAQPRLFAAEPEQPEEGLEEEEEEFEEDGKPIPKKRILRSEEVSDDEGEAPPQVFPGGARSLPWASQTLATLWLHRARENL